jgi:hypothetical protein
MIKGINERLELVGLEDLVELNGGNYDIFLINFYTIKRYYEEQNFLELKFLFIKNIEFWEKEF